MAESKPFDLVYRGTYGNDLLGNIVFVAGRGLDPLLQRYLLLNSPLPRLASILGISSSIRPVTGGAAISANGLTPFQKVMFYMAVGSGAKQIFWKFAIAREPIYPHTAMMIIFFNTTLNTLNTLAYNASANNPAFFPPWSVYAGIAVYIIGMVIETVAELQRSSFKSNPKNEGKIYTEGLFSIVRHISYTGYSLFRGGYALAAGGPLWGTFVLAFFLRDFGRRAIPVVDAYMTKRYGEQWAQVKQKIPYALIPGVW